MARTSRASAEPATRFRFPQLRAVAVDAANSARFGLARLPRPAMYGSLLLAVCVALVPIVRAYREDSAMVVAVRVERGSVATRIPAVTEGRVTAAREVPVKSEFSSRVNRVLVRPGARVCAGDALLELDADDLQGAVRLATSALDSARATARELSLRTRLARRVAAQNAELARVGAVTKSDCEKAGSEAQILTQSELSAVARVAEFEERYENAKRAATRSVVRAPIDALVTSVAIVEGELVSPRVPMVVLSDVSELYIAAQIDASDAGKIEVGMPVELRVDETPRRLRSFVARTAPSISKTAHGTSVLDIQVALVDGISSRLGAGVEVDVITKERENVLVVPTSAVVSSGPRQEVFVVQDGFAARRQVSLGLRSFTAVEVTHGLRASDVVVEQPSAIHVNEPRRVNWELGPTSRGAGSP